MKIIDRFCPEDYFKKIVDGIVWNYNFTWNLQDVVATDDENQFDWYATHIVYKDSSPLSPYWEGLGNLVYSLPDFRSLIRVKINFYSRTETIIEHAKHIDCPFEHKGAILSLNTCDGFTRLEDDTKIESIANRLLVFDSSKPHNSSTTTNAKGRFNININYL